MTTLEFFWDVASPYTYLAATQVPGLIERTGATVEYRPFLLGGVFKATANTMPTKVASKGRWMMHDLERWAKLYEVPLTLPGDAPFPINSLLPMRVALAADRLGRGPEFCDAVFAAYWGRGEDVSSPEVLGAVVQSMGWDPREAVAEASSQPIKDALRANTEEAVSRGAFGAPAFFIGEALYFGNDRMEHIEAALKTPP